VRNTEARQTAEQAKYDANEKPAGCHDAIGLARACLWLEARCAVLESAFNTRLWTRKMNDAWHWAIPDTNAAFKALLAALEGLGIPSEQFVI
jgi:hypothetical protein